MSRRCQAAGAGVPPEGCPNEATHRIFFPTRDGPPDTANVCLECSVRLAEEGQDHGARGVYSEPLP